MLRKLWFEFMFWLRGTDMYNDRRYKRFMYKGDISKYKEILARQKPHTFFRIGWLILITNNAKSKVWIYRDSRREDNHG